MSADNLTFVHRFSRIVQCTMTVRDEPPAPGALMNLAFEWVGRPKAKHIAAYRRWVLTTQQFLCDRWQKLSLYALGTKPDKTELWVFEPGKTPRLLKKLNVGIPW